jgi:hypothetical protein
MQLNTQELKEIYTLANSSGWNDNLSPYAEIIKESSIKRTLKKVDKIRSCCDYFVNEPTTPKSLLASYLRETAEEVESTELTILYLVSLLPELISAIQVATQDLIQKEKANANYKRC